MKQVLQNLKSGATQVVEVPCPKCQPGCLLIQTVNSLISVGTERMLVEFGRANWFEKARQQPEKVKQVIGKIKTDGLGPTIQTIQTKLEQPQPLGYSNAGIVLEIGEGVEGFEIGDRVLSNGRHAQVVCVPKNLCAKIPDQVSFNNAAFGVIASIGLQGIRLLNPTLGEKIVVTGLGLIGQLTVQMLIANGCEVLGIDVDTAKCVLAKKYGAKTVNLSNGEDPISAVQSFTDGRGIDGVLITAKSNSSNIIHEAAQMCRKRGRIVLVGVVGLELQRSDFYEKELSFQVSCSYGPGRYDKNYEQNGIDYPHPFVRWTEKRNFEAVLGMMGAGTLKTKELVSHVFDIEESEKAYDVVASGDGTGVLLNYPQIDEYEIASTLIALPTPQALKKPKTCIGIIGAGNFTGQRILPVLRKLDVTLKTIVSTNGVSGSHLGVKYGFANSSTDARDIFNDPEINLVFITTRHDTHAQYVQKALENGKNVFVEKPLAIKTKDIKTIEEIIKCLGHKCPSIMVGFNRRFSPHIVKARGLLNNFKCPKSIIYTINAGFVPADHWTRDAIVGGGRIAGEACHFIDLCQHLIGQEITESNISYMKDTGDVATINIRFKDGSIASIHYYANGHKSFRKERIEIFFDGKILEIDNFKKTIGYGLPKFTSYKSSGQNKGHKEEIAAFVESVRHGQTSPIPISEIFKISRITIELSNACT